MNPVTSSLCQKLPTGLSQWSDRLQHAFGLFLKKEETHHHLAKAITAAQLQPCALPEAGISCMPIHMPA